MVKQLSLSSLWVSAHQALAPAVQLNLSLNIIMSAKLWDYFMPILDLNIGMQGVQELFFFVN